MMAGGHTLLLRLVGPLQAWGTDSRFGLRDTDGEPSRSGVTGLLCAALGWDRKAVSHEVAGRTLTLAEVATWRFGVRVVQEGERVRDFHTAGKAPPGRSAGFLRADGKVEKTDVVVTERFYLSDAAFVVGFEAGDRAVLEAVLAALERPVWPLALGRSACPPSLPVALGVVDAPLAEALCDAEDPCYGRLYGVARGAEGRLPPGRLVLDADVADAVLTERKYTAVREARRADVPRSFDPRLFDARQVRVYVPTVQPAAL